MGEPDKILNTLYSLDNAMIGFNPEEFVRKAIEEIRSLNIDHALAAVSGGVDSTTAAVLTYRAIGERLVAVFLDTGFMRLNEPERVVNLLKDILPTIELVDVKEEFYREILGLSDAETKRKVFRKVFYTVLARIAKSRGCSWLVQGTIAPDWIETRGGIKTQHNVLTQIGIDPVREFGFKVVEPLRELYKDQVRQVAKYLGIPDEIVNRQPFPGPGLLVRCVGTVTLEKLNVLKHAHKIVEESLADLGLSQWFAAIWEYQKVPDEELTRHVQEMTGLNVKVYTFGNIYATGVKGDSRVYGPIALIEGDIPEDVLYRIYSYITTRRSDIAHVIYNIEDRGSGKYYIAIRAVITSNYMTARVAKIALSRLREIADKIMRELPEVAAVGYDVSPKPPATIEFE